MLRASLAKIAASIKNIVAVDNVSFVINQGICFGLMGPNGAGKTTTIEVIEDVLKPTSGRGTE